MRTYTMTNDSGDHEIEAANVREALEKAISITRQGDWQPEDDPKRVITQRVTVVDDNDPDDCAEADAQMWP